MKRCRASRRREGEAGAGSAAGGRTGYRSPVLLSLLIVGLHSSPLVSAYIGGARFSVIDRYWDTGAAPASSGSGNSSGSSGASGPGAQQFGGGGGGGISTEGSSVTNGAGSDGYGPMGRGRPPSGGGGGGGAAVGAAAATVVGAGIGGRGGAGIGALQSNSSLPRRARARRRTYAPRALLQRPFDKIYSSSLGGVAWAEQGGGTTTATTSATPSYYYSMSKRPLRVITDIDDTVKSSGNKRLAGIPLGGVDAQYERGAFYPGVAQFALELARFGSAKEIGPLPVAVLTARAREFKVALEINAEHPISQKFRETGEREGEAGWGIGPVLYGSVKEWIIQSGKSVRKFSNFKLLMRADGAYIASKMGVPPAQLNDFLSAECGGTALSAAAHGDKKSSNSGGSSGRISIIGSGRSRGSLAGKTGKRAKAHITKGKTLLKNTLSKGSQRTPGGGSGNTKPQSPSPSPSPSAALALARGEKEEPPLMAICDYIFIGDTGEGDAKAGDEMCIAFPQVMRAVFMHVVSGAVDGSSCPTGRTVNGVPVVYFKTYIGAARQAFKLGLMDREGLDRVVEAAKRDLTEYCEAASEASGGEHVVKREDCSKWRDLLDDIHLIRQDDSAWPLDILTQTLSGFWL